MKVEAAEKKEFPKKAVIIALSIIIAGLIIIYFSMTFFFMDRFYFNTNLNGVDISCDTVENVEANLSDDNAYKLDIKGMNGEEGIIDGQYIKIKYDLGDQIKNLKKKQNPFGWITSIFKKDVYDLEFGITYDESLLKESINKLPWFDGSERTESKNASLVFEDGQCKIIDEVYGNKPDEEKTYNLIVDAVKKEKPTLSLEEEGCFPKPEITKDSQQIVDAKNTVDKYMSTSVTYVWGNSVIDTVDSSKIADWISLDDNLNVSINKEAILSYMQTLDNTYDTVGNTRSFKTTGGSVINVSGGDYGWIMDSAAEADNMYNLILEGAQIQKEPEYIQRGYVAGSDDIGNTYVEISISQQHLWLYSNGSLIADGDVVTGNDDSKHNTPPGVYYVYSMEPNSILRGVDYATPVAFWMPFNQDIGIHDATWRPAFGGTIYKGDGSHGCVNAPYSLAQTIFNTISVGTPVVCY